MTTIAALGPFFVGQIMTTQMATHEILHIAQITFGIFLVIVSVIAYISTKNRNMIFTLLAFVTFTGLSTFLLQEDLNADRMEHDEAIIVDVLLTVMAGFFAIGVFSNHKFSNRTKYN
jgi:TctA family transporter